MKTDKKEIADFLRELAEEIEEDKYYEVMIDLFNHSKFLPDRNIPSDYIQDLGKSITIRLSPKRVILGAEQ